MYTLSFRATEGGPNLAEYRREIGTAVGVAVVMAIVIGSVALYYFPSPSGLNYSTTVSSGFSTSTVASRTLPFAQTYTNRTVASDPSLTVSLVQDTLQTETNATAIAQVLALGLNALPISLVSQKLPTCSDNSILCTEADYQYKTNDRSNMSVAFIKGKFYELDYVSYDYWKLVYGNAVTSNPSFNTTKADAQVEQLMANAFGVPLNNETVFNQLPPHLSSTDYVVQWGEGYRGTPIANSGSIYFEFYPPMSKLVRIIIIEYGGSVVTPLLGWYQVPSSFPLDVQPSTALSSAESYAMSTLHVSSTVYSSVSFQVVHNQMYYAVTVSSYTAGYVLFVNPRTGEIGFPQA